MALCSEEYLAAALASQPQVDSGCMLRLELAVDSGTGKLACGLTVQVGTLLCLPACSRRGRAACKCQWQGDTAELA